MPSTNDIAAERLGDVQILSLRPPKNQVVPEKPYAFLVEPERTCDGKVEDTAVVFLTNRECPFRCLMCDLWKNTLDKRVPDGAIATQIEYALARMPPARHIKLYNAGNFFDAQAIPLADWPDIAELLRSFQTVVVESHPRLIGPKCLEFGDLLMSRSGVSKTLEIAMGLETVHPEMLDRLNKNMTLSDFESASQFLTKNGIRVRAFILLRPPFLDEQEGIDWAKRSIRFAFDVGVECCVVIPTRAGNGAMEELRRLGHFAQPRLESLEKVVEYGIGLNQGRVLADVWDADKFSTCSQCRSFRVQRLRAMNLSQQIPTAIDCPCGAGQ